jgi:hypothetical protein
MQSEQLPNLFSIVEPILAGKPAINPWARIGEALEYQADYGTLEELLTVPVREGSGSQSGRLAKAIDAWVAFELRRSGFADDEVWPRLTSPRVLPREVALFVESLPTNIRPAAEKSLLRNRRVAPSEARVLGRAYVKQVDVLIAQWSRGPELLVSTKSMTSSFRKNLPNRFEEAYGDAKNLRGRYPLVAMGFVFLLKSTVLSEPGTIDRAVDMLRKLKAEGDVYDTTCLLVAGWDDRNTHHVQVMNELVPSDLTADHFLATLVNSVLARTPVDMHVAVRSRREHRDLQLAETDTTAPLDD